NRRPDWRRPDGPWNLAAELPARAAPGPRAGTARRHSTSGPSASGSSRGLTVMSQMSHVNHADVAADCAELELSPAYERRQWRRFMCNLHALCRVMKAPIFPMFEGTIVNLSLHGAAIWVGQELGRGTRISARLFNATD